MKKISMLIAFGLITLPSAFAAPCQVGLGTTNPGTALSNWLTSNFSCTIGDKTFSNFTYIPSGTNPVPASAVTVNAIGPSGTGALITGSNIGLQFNAPWNAAGMGLSSDAAIGFTVTVTGGGPQLISDLGLAQVSGVNPNGSASVAELICGTGPSCTPNAFSTLTFQSSATCPGPGCVLTATTTLTSNFGSVNVIKDIAASGGGIAGGFADLSVVQDTFSQTSVPEPVSMGLLGGGLALLGFARLRRSGRKA
jgi:hypothetical protein